MAFNSASICHNHTVGLVRLDGGNLMLTAVRVGVGVVVASGPPLVCMVGSSVVAMRSHCGHHCSISAARALKASRVEQKFY